MPVGSIIDGRLSVTRYEAMMKPAKKAPFVALVTWKGFARGRR